MPLIKTIKSKYFWGLSKNTFLLAAASLFADISTEMLYPILPIFLTQTLKTGGGVVGIVEGIAQATQNIIQGFSGYISDRFKTRKPLALIGYIFAALSKPLIGISQTWPQVLFARFMDRFGTGTRSAPRDALIADSAPGQFRGKAFGLEGVGDNLGAFLGPIIAIILLFYMSVGIRSIFFLSLIPGLLAVIMIYLVKEEPAKNNLKTRVELIGKKFPKPYLKYLFVISLFGLGNSSNSFLILETKSIGASLELTILIYAFFNLVASFISYPSGSLSDKLGRKNILLLSFIIFIITYIGFALSNNIFIIAFLFILYGLYQGIFRAVGKALAADLVPSHLRASGVGWYSTAIGLTGLFASITAGQLWDRVGHTSVFIFGAIFAFLGILALILFNTPAQNTGS